MKSLPHRISVKHVFWVSFVVFLVLNSVENLLHYSIGRTPQESRLAFIPPNGIDLFRIVAIMVLFGSIQAYLTSHI